MAGEPRRVGAQTSETRTRILDAAEELLRDQGYGALSTRRVAACAGLKPSLVHYYFPTTEDLLLAVNRAGAEESDRMLEAALASEDPLSELWSVYLDTSRTAMALEMMAMANRRPALRDHMARHCRLMREREARLFAKMLGDRIERIEGLTPEALSLILVGIGRAIVMEDNLGVDEGHEAARKFVAAWLSRMAHDS